MQFACVLSFCLVLIPWAPLPSFERLLLSWSGFFDLTGPTYTRWHYQCEEVRQNPAHDGGSSWSLGPSESSVSAVRQELFLERRVILCCGQLGLALESQPLAFPIGSCHELRTMFFHHWYFCPHRSVGFYGLSGRTLYIATWTCGRAISCSGLHSEQAVHSAAWYISGSYTVFPGITAHASSLSAVVVLIFANPSPLLPRMY